MSTIQIKILTPMRRYPTVGAVITTEVDHAGIIKDNFLRRRLRDSTHDDCVQIVASEKPTKTAKNKAPALEDSTHV